MTSVTDRMRETEPSTGNAGSAGPRRRELAQVLADRFRERNYASAYLARRCRTTDQEILEWASGERVPDFSCWGLLCAVSRDFSAHTSLWEAARAEAMAAPPAGGSPSGSIAELNHDPEGAEGAERPREAAPRTHRILRVEVVEIESPGPDLTSARGGRVVDRFTLSEEQQRILLLACAGFELTTQERTTLRPAYMFLMGPSSPGRLPR